MGTRSDIIRENLDGPFDRIYCHWDGYPSNNGRILLEYYTDPAKIAELFALGDLSSLGKELGEKHDFDAAPDDVCNAYGRDRGESGTKTRHFPNSAELSRFLGDSWGEYVYTFRVVDGKWYWTNNPSPTWFKLCGSTQRDTELLTPSAWEESGVGA